MIEKGKIDNSDYKRRNSDKGVSLRNTMYNTVKCAIHYVAQCNTLYNAIQCTMQYSVQYSAVHNAI